MSTYPAGLRQSRYGWSRSTLVLSSKGISNVRRVRWSCGKSRGRSRPCPIPRDRAGGGPLRLLDDGASERSEDRKKLTLLRRRDPHRIESPNERLNHVIELGIRDRHPLVGASHVAPRIHTGSACRLTNLLHEVLFKGGGASLFTAMERPSPEHWICASVARAAMKVAKSISPGWAKAVAT